MTGEPPFRRGVTRGYVGALLVAVLILAIALTVAAWGFLAVWLDRGPVVTQGVSQGVIVFVVLVAVAVLAAGLWQQALALLRGYRPPLWGAIVAVGGGAYLVWALGGMLVGLTLQETWLSPFGLVLAVVWALASLLFWAVLTRRVYTDRPVPKWPWEKRGEPGPDWAFPPERSDDPDEDDGQGSGTEDSR